MILDSEEQRKLLLEIINNVPMQGDYAGIKKLLVTFDELAIAVRTASIQEKPEERQPFSPRLHPPAVEDILDFKHDIEAVPLDKSR